MKKFFATVQNKLRGAIAGKPAAEIIYDSADAEKVNMGLITKISVLNARLKAEQEYDVYRERQDLEFVSDFDREIKRIRDAQERDDNL